MQLSAEERAAKLAELREKKAQLLEAKARAAKLQEEKARAAAAEHYADLEDGRQRGLRGFALKEHAAKLAEARQEAAKLTALEAQTSAAEEKSCAQVTQDEAASQHQPDDVAVHSQAQDAEVLHQTGQACYDGTGLKDDDSESDSEDNEGPVLLDPESQMVLDSIRVKSGKHRSQVERNEEQQAEYQRRKEQADFLASQPEKIKNVTRKGHHRRGRQHNRLST
eukprot:TRINITY_DN97935_c0_g1_i1.p1 TRINITY_DN97935_c0_g1~~TRINITY_DN97935_c0_g1_i1.p1  ORF type:complete len:223 (-),score=71.43 TRINITY_DN97935_c0_g1_i1:40-708(-)